MKKQAVLLWGNGKILKENILWIRQLYEVIGITGKDVIETDLSKGLFTVDGALSLNYDRIMITSMFYDEIKNELIEDYHINPDEIIYFLDEFNSERKISFGTKNKDTTMYVWRIPYRRRKNGFANFIEELFYAYDFCYKNGYELLVDMKYYYSSYAGEKYGEVNVWEEYFLQPSKYSLEDAYESENVILSGTTFEAIATEIYYEGVQKCVDHSIFLGEAYGEKFIYSRVLGEHIDNELTRMNWKGKKILGVIARGTDYIVLKPKGHPIPCACNQYVEYIKDFMMRYDYQYIYLATEDLDIFNYFVKEFAKETLLFSEQKRISLDEKKLLMDIKLYDEDDGCIRGMEYNLVLAMLAKCNGLIANCLCGAAVGALMQSMGKYNHVEIMDEGKWD